MRTQFQANTLWIALGTSFGTMLVITLLFSLVRPYNTVVYAPKIKYADRKHAPPPVGKGLFAWLSPIAKTKEDKLVEKVGLDAAVFLRFLKMCRNMFLVLSVFGCGILIPVHVETSYLHLPETIDPVTRALSSITPLNVSGNPIWSHVVASYLVDFTVIFFLWTNYRAIVRLKKNYFRSPEYVQSLSSRSIWLTDIPPADRTDEGILRVCDAIEQTSSLPRAAIARNVKELPQLIDEHSETVRKLESVLAKYLKDPDNLPLERPTIKPSKKDRRADNMEKVDAIDYLTNRIKDLEVEIKDVRESIDKRNPMPYGFATYDRIEDAHVVAYEGRKKKPLGVRVRLAPRPNDLLWPNLGLSKGIRARKRITINFWVFLLTVIWIVPNALIAVFLSNLTNLKGIWPAFAQSFNAHPGTWQAVQAILAPALLSLVYLLLPIFFRRLSTRSGDLTKTSRERHVTHKLYAFFVFNNLFVFSLFSTLWRFVAGVVANTQNGQDAWQAIQDQNLPNLLLQAFCVVSNFWFIWLIQRNLGAAIDLAQLFNLAWKWFARTFMSPTPRQAIEWTAPPPFDYATYYNWFLFYATVALCFATVQPLVLLVTFVYFVIDCWLKKYLLLYIFITKTESGGQFWNVLFNRILFGTFLANCVATIVIKGCAGSYTMMICMIPLPFILLGFKWYCSNTYSDQCRYYVTSLDTLEGGVDPVKKSRRHDRVGVKFGHPALYKPLITPMVHAKAKHVLAKIYQGRTEQDNSNFGYSDIMMDPMSGSQPGKTATAGLANDMFEVVPESNLDFSYFKNRADFAGDHGGDGELYGRPIDLISERSQTPKSFMNGSDDELSRAGTPPVPAIRQQRPDELQNHPAFRKPLPSHNDSFYNMQNDSQRSLLGGATHPAGYNPVPANQPGEVMGLEDWRPGGSGYAGASGQADDDDLGYEAYRPALHQQDSLHGYK
jgi:calcium permeable stress-gated cation channel